MNKYFYIDLDKNDLPKWERGRVFNTPKTRNFPEALKAQLEKAEARLICSDVDAEKPHARQLVVTLHFGHPEYEFNRALIEAAPALLRAFLEVLGVGETASLESIMKISCPEIKEVLKMLTPNDAANEDPKRKPFLPKDAFR